MATIYLVTSGQYSSYSVDAAFSTTELARAWVGHATEHYTIEALELDPAPRDERVIWEITMPLADTQEAPGVRQVVFDDESLEVLVYRDHSAAEWRVDGYHAAGRCEQASCARVVVEVEANRDRETAVKYANEIRARLLAMHGPGIERGLYDPETCVRRG